MFKPTHIFTFGERSHNNKLTHPNGVEVMEGSVDEDGYTEWLGDSNGNVVGYTKGYETNPFGSYVSVLNSEE